MKVGLFFGSFNPIHIGHLIIGNTILQKARLDEVWYIVSPQNPFKKNKGLLHEFDRLEMVERAIADNHKLKASDIEFTMPKPSYTIDTLTVLAEKFPKHDFSLLMGEDNLVGFKRWKNYKQILEYYELLVYSRPKSTEHDFHNHPKVTFVDAPLLDISATYIRKAVKNKESIKYLVTEVVASHIDFKGYYL